MAREIQAINPATEELIATYPIAQEKEIEDKLQGARDAFATWRRVSFGERGGLMRGVAGYLRHNKDELASIITLEMGKPIGEAEAEVEKCAWNCDFYSEKAAQFLAPVPVESSASSSHVQFPPLGVILAIMPWNFPFWQTFRFAAPALMAGNTAILKHASNVPGCALAIERAFVESGFPSGVFRNLIIPGSAVDALISDPRIAAVTLTGSDTVGSQVAGSAGRALKKTVLELGGSDPFIVLPDADIDLAVRTGIRARFQNTGQSCIAAKRFILVADAYRSFEERFVQAAQELQVGDPLDRANQLGPLARADLREGIEKQVARTVEEGGRLATGGKRLFDRGFFYAPTVLTDTRPSMTAAREEVFGPVAALMKADSVPDAIRMANASPFGLGASLWTRDTQLARKISADIETGQVFVNGMVASDPRLPFGGVKRSGYGRELADFGIREFVNVQTVWIR